MYSDLELTVHKTEPIEGPGIGGQYNEPEILGHLIGNKCGGRLVEVGANHPWENSHTRPFLRDRGWSGIMIEPHPGFASMLSAVYFDNPLVHVVPFAVSPKSGSQPFVCHGGYSRLESSAWDDSVTYPGEVGPTISVPAGPLDLILDFFGPEWTGIDFLSIDAEGCDLEIVRAMDFSSRKYGVICIEHGKEWQEFDRALGEGGYKRVAKNLGNSFYVPA